MLVSKPYEGQVVFIDGKPFGIVERYSPSVKLFSIESGRWSQTSPPDATLPVKMRKIKGVDPGWPQLGYDLSNAELRILGVMSGDEVFLEAFRLGWDLHTLGACELFGLDYPPLRGKECHTNEICAAWRSQYAWTGDEDPRRKFSKIFGFRVAYGGDPKGGWKIPGAKKLGLTRPELEQAGYRWLAAHPKLNAFWDRFGTEAMEKFCVRNAFGRRRILCSQDDQARRREGINHPIQSFVSDLINQIVVETYYGLCPNVRLVGQMHDAIVWAFPDEHFERCAQLALEIAERTRVVGGLSFQIPVSYYTKGWPYSLM